MSENLYDEINVIWNKNEKEYKNKLLQWKENLLNAKEQVEIIRKANSEKGGFHQWGKLRIYTAYSSVKNKKPVFSLRYRGQDVAKIIADVPVKIKISDDQRKKNNESFKIDYNSGEYNWTSTEAREFRKKFLKKGYTYSNSLNMKSDEAWLQSLFFKEMKKSTNDGFKNFQPVLLGKFPVQWPVPISGNKGKPKNSSGHLDILARRREGNRTHLSIWELKKPGAFQEDISFPQVYIYGVTLAKMIRDDKTWYKIFGLNEKVSLDKEILIDIILTISEDKKKEVLDSIKKFDSPLKLKDENVLLRPFVAFYSWDKKNEEITIQEIFDIKKNV